MQNFFSKLAPFLVFGITIFIFIAGIIIFSYILIFGALIGIILFAVQCLRNKFTVKKIKKVEKKGRTINHDDL